MSAPTPDPTTDADDTIATPEGDNEYTPGEPLSSNAPAPERPRGDQPHTEEPLYPADGA